MFDNASGTVTNLELLRYLKKYQPKRTIRFIFTGSEERGLLGSKAYVEAHKSELESIRLCINVDMTGPVLGYDSALVMAEQAVCHAMDFYKKEIGFAMEVKQDIYSSDAIPFADNGIPGINFFRRAAADSTKIHCRYDIISTVTAKSLARTADFILNFTRKLDTAVYFPVERTVPTEIVEKVDKYLRKAPQK
jgi:Zn-dependent M28 family amino/carboxypeptidase